MTDYVNISAYKFINLTNLQVLREKILAFSLALDLKGTVLLSEEGINLFVSGPADSITQFKHFISVDLEMGELPYKDSPSSHKPFRRMLVRLKKEIISMGCPEIKPASMPAPRVSTTEFKEWLDNDEDMIVLDTRNDYEIRVGKFSDAMELDIKTFRAFPDAIDALPQEMKNKKIVTYCTGGIRCEKAAPLMIEKGFTDVYQLDGGILKYFEDCGGEHYQDDCFVFDRRVALNADLDETDTTQCYACRAPLTPEEQALPNYQVGVSCVYCTEEATQASCASE